MPKPHKTRLYHLLYNECNKKFLSSSGISKLILSYVTAHPHNTLISETVNYFLVTIYNPTLYSKNIPEALVVLIKNHMLHAFLHLA